MRRPRVASVAAALLGLLVLAGCGDGSEVVSSDVVSAEQVHLISVTDGDTLVVGLANGARANVRLIGIDTPETYPELECGGAPAASNMQHLVSPGDTLTLYVDRTQDAVDKYGRLLRYVVTSKDVDVGLNQVRTGLATVYVYHGNPFANLDTYLAAEDEARSRNGGNWGAC